MRKPFRGYLEWASHKAFHIVNIRKDRIFLFKIFLISSFSEAAWFSGWRLGLCMIANYTNEPKISHNCRFPNVSSFPNPSPCTLRFPSIPPLYIYFILQRPIYKNPLSLRSVWQTLFLFHNISKPSYMHVKQCKTNIEFIKFELLKKSCPNLRQFTTRRRTSSF